VASFPVAGVSSVVNDNEETIVRFIARENGHIFEIPTDSTSRKRISNTTILRIWDTLWLSGGERFVARFVDEDSSEIESFYAEIIQEKEIENANTLEGSFLQKNIKEMTYSKDKDKIFYIIPNGDGSVGVVSNPDGSKKVQILDSPISEWKAQWPEKDTIALTTKPSFNIPGHLYFLDVETEQLKSVLSNVNGLTTLVNSSAKKVLFTHNQADRLLLSVFDLNKEEVTDLPLWALAEKCVWSEKNNNIIYCGVSSFIPRGESLDLWYQGMTSFSDDIWMIDIETQTAKVLVSPANIAGEEIDLIKPVLSEDENYLFFVNKRDSSLWQLKLKS
jgi:Tol biopolymer transport system component